MDKLFINSVATLADVDTLDRAALRPLAGNFAGAAARRMTPLGLLLGEVLKDVELAVEKPVIYATTFAEARTVERFIDSFPTASPLAFQQSIHPSAVEQVLINRKISVRELYPLAGEDGLAAQALRLATSIEATDCVLCGGEELATWLAEEAAASTDSFAFALELSRERSGGAVGEVEWAAEGTAGAEGATKKANLPDFFKAVHGRDDAILDGGESGTVRVRWW